LRRHSRRPQRAIRAAGRVRLSENDSMMKRTTSLVPLGLTVFVVACLVAVPTAGQQQAPPRAQFPTYRAPRLAGGHPDLNGIWQRFVTANGDLQDHEAQAGPHPEIMGAYGAGPAGQSIVEGGEIPYQPWALAKKKENFEKRMSVDVSDDKKWHAL